jgi:hypothetical protein
VPRPFPADKSYRGNAESSMVKKLSLFPKHPERICWGCDLYCAADDLRCGNGTDRAQHPIEIFGAGWMDAAIDDSAHSGDEYCGEAAPGTTPSG